MSTELESRLRQDLAATQVEIPVDLERTLLAGHRAVGARRIGWGIGALALVAGVAVLMPKSLPDRIPAVPAPVQTPGHATVTFEPQSFRSNETVIDLDAATLELSGGAGGAVEVTATVTLNGEAPLRDTFTVADPSSIGTHQLGEQVAIGLAPSNRWIDWLLEGTDQHFFPSQEAEPFGLTAYLLLSAPTDPQWTVRGAIWQQPDGEVRNNLGERVSAAELLGPGATIYADPELDVVGVHLASGGGASAPLSSREVGELALAGAMGSDDESGTWATTTYEFYLVPADAVGDVTVARWTDAGEALVGTLEGGPWAGRTYVWASVKHAKYDEPGELLKSVTYRNAAGEVITVPIRR